MTSQRRDIETREDCECLVREFYSRALTDSVIGFLFVDVAHLDLEAHVPRITSFWETVLLGARSYGGGAFAPHISLNAKVPLRAGHFARWVSLWEGAVDALFTGDRAELAKQHARRVASAFHARLETITAATSSAPAGEQGAGGQGAGDHKEPALVVIRARPAAAGGQSDADRA